MAKKTKNPSLAKVAKTYRKNTKQNDQGWDGGRFFNEGGKSQGLGGSTRKNTYKPAPKDITLGGTRKGRGATTKKLGRA